MKADKVRQMDDKELQLQAKDIRERLFRLRFQFGMGQTDGLKKYRELKKDQARILGVLRERQLSASAEKGS